MVVDIRVVLIMPDGRLKVTERTRGVAQLHVHTGDLDPALNESRKQVQTLFEILPGALRVADEESAVLVCRMQSQTTHLKVPRIL